MNLTALDSSYSALVLIDLQRGVVNLPEETHLFSIRQILPRLGQVRSIQEVLAMCTVTAG